LSGNKQHISGVLCFVPRNSSQGRVDERSFSSSRYAARPCELRGTKQEASREEGGNSNCRAGRNLISSVLIQGGRNADAGNPDRIVTVSNADGAVFAEL
jgi:hypothetical protein